MQGVLKLLSGFAYRTYMIETHPLICLVGKSRNVVAQLKVLRDSCIPGKPVLKSRTIIALDIGTSCLRHS